MKFRLVLLAIALATPALLAGCVGGDKPSGVDINQSGSGLEPDNIKDGKIVAKARTELKTTVTASSDWVKPGEAVTLEATPPAGASGAIKYAWSFAPRAAAGADPHAGHDMGGAAPAASAAPKGLDTGNLGAGTSSAPMTFAKEGLYDFHCHPHPLMKMTVTVAKGGKAGTQHVQIVDGDDVKHWGFVPDAITIAPGAKIVFWNNGTMMHTATQEGEIRTPIAGSGPKITFTPAAAGDLDVIVTVTDGKTGHGRAATRVLVDAAKPDETKTFDPMTGAWNGATPVGTANEQIASAKTHSVVADYEISALTLSFTATSSAAGGVSVQLLPQGGGEPIAALDPGMEGTVTLTDLSLPAGGYTVQVTPEAGLQIEYTVTLQIVQKLVAPDSAPAAEGDGHGHDH